MLFIRLEEPCQVASPDRFLLSIETSPDHSWKSRLQGLCFSLGRNLTLNQCVSCLCIASNIFRVLVHEVSLGVVGIDVDLRVAHIPHLLCRVALIWISLFVEKCFTCRSLLIIEVQGVAHELSQAHRCDLFVKELAELLRLGSIDFDHDLDESAHMIVRKARKLGMTEYVGQETEYFRVDELNISLWCFIGLFRRG